MGMLSGCREGLRGAGSKKDGSVFNCAGSMIVFIL